VRRRAFVIAADCRRGGYMAVVFFGRSARTRGTHVNQKRKIIMIIIKILKHIHLLSACSVVVVIVLYRVYYIFFLKVPTHLYYIIMCISVSFVSYGRDDANSYPKSWWIIYTINSYNIYTKRPYSSKNVQSKCICPKQKRVQIHIVHTYCI